MAKRRGPAARAASGNAGGAGKVLLGVLLGGAAAAGGGYLYLHSSGHPVGQTASETRNQRLSRSAQTETVPEQPAPPPASPDVQREVPGSGESDGRQPPFGASEDVFEAGAAVYLQRCARCHGTVRRDAPGPAGQRAAQLFRAGRDRPGEQTPGQVFAAINLGAQGLGMPAYHGILTDQQIWQVVLLLRSAREPLPEPVIDILDGR